MGYRLFVTTLVVLVVQLASAARTQQQQLVINNPAGAPGSTKQSTNRLNTYYFDAFKPFGCDTHGSARAGRSTLTVSLSSSSVSTFLPYVSPAPTAMTHSVSRTWQTLKVSWRWVDQPSAQHC